MNQTCTNFLQRESVASKTVGPCVRVFVCPSVCGLNVWCEEYLSFREVDCSRSKKSEKNFVSDSRSATVTRHSSASAVFLSNFLVLHAQYVIISI